MYTRATRNGAKNHSRMKGVHRGYTRHAVLQYTRSGLFFLIIGKMKVYADQRFYIKVFNLGLEVSAASPLQSNVY